MERFNTRSHHFTLAILLTAGALIMATPARADETSEALQTLTDALTGAAAGAAASSTTIEDPQDAIPDFESRQDRREYFRKLKTEDPEKFRRLKERALEARRERREEWIGQHPGAAHGMRDQQFESGRDGRRPGMRGFHDQGKAKGHRWSGKPGRTPYYGSGACCPVR